ncbi:Uncharacterised protein g8424 [Pycnogonum litorale]
MAIERNSRPIYLCCLICWSVLLSNALFFDSGNSNAGIEIIIKERKADETDIEILSSNQNETRVLDSNLKNDRSSNAGYNSRNPNADTPSSFSILLNFGFGGQRLYYRAETEYDKKQALEKCTDESIWDSFTKICRKLYCAKGYTLKDLHCVRVPEESDSADYVEGDKDMYLVHEKHQFLTFKFSMTETNLSSINETALPNLVKLAVVKMFNVSDERVTNVTIRMICKKKVLSDGDGNDSYTVTYETSLKIENPRDTDAIEPSSEEIASTMAWTVSTRSLVMKIGDSFTRVNSLHETTPFNDSMTHHWCKGGKKLEYWNEDFTMIHDNRSSQELSIQRIYVNKTERFYEIGYFLASILYYARQGPDNVKTSGTVLVCDGLPKITVECNKTKLNKTEYNIASNGTIKYLGDLSAGSILDLDNIEIDALGNVTVCLKNNVADSRLVRFLDIRSASEGLVSTILTSISVTALLLTLFAYAFLSKLRNLPGCNAMNLTLSILIFQVSFLIGQNHPTNYVCKVLSVMTHFFILASFFWMNVMAYDLYKTFGHCHILTNVRSKKKYLHRYALYAYGVPGFFICVGIVAENCKYISFVKPMYGRDEICWIGSHNAAIYLFCVPVIAVIVINSIFFTLIIRSMRKLRKQIRRQLNQVRGHSYWLLYVRKSTVVGFTWIFAFLAAYVHHPKILGEIFLYCFIVFNTLQGVFIFCAFVMTKRVLKLTEIELSSVKKTIKKTFRENAAKISQSPSIFMNNRASSSETVVTALSWRLNISPN